MQNVNNAMALALLLTALGGCRNDRSDQNITITDNVPANADIEALPADESSGTSSNDLVNGSDSSNDVGNNSSDY